MDKRKVIQAYRRGLLTIQECSQILGIESPHLLGVDEEQIKVDLYKPVSRHTVSG